MVSSRPMRPHMQVSRADEVLVELNERNNRGGVVSCSGLAVVRCMILKWEMRMRSRSRSCEVGIMCLIQLSCCVRYVLGKFRLMM